MNATQVTLKLKRRKLELLYLVVMTDKGGLVRGIVTKPDRKDDYPEDAWDHLGELVRQQILVKAGQEKGEDIYRINKNPPKPEDEEPAPSAKYTPVLESLAGSEPNTSA